jgi:hypothetical protein
MQAPNHGSWSEEGGAAEGGYEAAGRAGREEAKILHIQQQQAPGGGWGTAGEDKQEGWRLVNVSFALGSLCCLLQQLWAFHACRQQPSPCGHQAIGNVD